MEDHIFDADDSVSLSSDSGLESSEETRPLSTESIYSLDNGVWNEFSVIDPPINISTALPFIQNSCLGLLSCDTGVLKSSALQLFHLCRLGFAEAVLASSAEIFATLKSVVTANDISKHPELTHYLSGIFYHLTENDISAYLIPLDSILVLIIKLLAVPLESALHYTVAGLHNLLDRKNLREKFRTPPIITLLIQILWTCFIYDKSFHPPVTSNPYLAFASSTTLSKFLAIVCDCIYLLAHRNEMAKRLIHAKQGVVPLLYFVHTYPFEKTQCVCARLLRILSTHPHTKKDILRGDPALRFFKHSATSTFQRLSTNAFWTLRNLSDQCGSLANQQINETSELLLQRFRTVEHSLRCWKARIYSHYDLQERYTIVRCISGTLANFTCRNPFTKSFLVESGAVPLLSRLFTFSMNELSGHPTLCREASVGGTCVAPPKCDPIPSTLLSCPCGRRSLPMSLLQATVDCVEAALRCLSHLTSSHQLADEALHQLALDQPDSFLAGSKCVCWIVDLFHLTSDGSKSPGDTHVIRLVHEQCSILDTDHVLQLAKAWLSLARNCLAGSAWQSREQETTLRSAVVYLEENLGPFIESTPNSRTNAVVSVGGKNGGGGGGDSRFLPTQLTLSAARGPPTTGKTIFLSFPPYPCTPLVSTNCHYLQIGSVFEAP